MLNIDGFYDALLAFFAHEYRFERDITQSRRNTLSQPAREALTKLDGAIRITAYATRQDARGDMRKTITDFLAPYQRVKRDISGVMSSRATTVAMPVQSGNGRATMAGEGTTEDLRFGNWRAS